MIIELRAGLLDGQRIRTSLSLGFIWVKAGRAYRQRRKGAEPYRASHIVRHEEVLHEDRERNVTVVRPAVHMYDFIGHTHALCTGCQAVHRRDEDLVLRPFCPLCGGMLVKLSDLR